MNRHLKLIGIGHNIILQRGDDLSEVLMRLGLNPRKVGIVRKRPFTDRDTAMQFLETKAKSINYMDLCLAVAVQLPDTAEYIEAQNLLLELTHRIEHMPLTWSTNRQRQFTAMLFELARIHDMEHSVEDDARANYWMIYFNRNGNEHINEDSPLLHQAY